MLSSEKLREHLPKHNVKVASDMPVSEITAWLQDSDNVAFIELSERNRPFIAKIIPSAASRALPTIYVLHKSNHICLDADSNIVPFLRQLLAGPDEVCCCVCLECHESLNVCSKCCCKLCQRCMFAVVTNGRWCDDERTSFTFDVTCPVCRRVANCSCLA